MSVKPKPLNPFQGFIDFDNPPVEEKIWPDNSDFPLNRKWYTGRTTVLQEITKDINESEVYLVVTV